MGLGSLNTVGLAEAREKARAARQAVVADGINPIEARKAKKATTAVVKAKTATFERLAQCHPSPASRRF